MIDILWVHRPEESSLLDFISGLSWKLEICEDKSSSLDFLRKNQVSVMVYSLDKSDVFSDDIDFLGSVQNLAPNVVVLLNGPYLNWDSLRMVIETQTVSKFIFPGWETDIINGLIESSLRMYKKKSSENRLLYELKEQNKKLTEITTNLEVIVQDRTRNIESATFEAEANLNRLRRIVKFIRKLSRVSTLEELFIDLRHEVKKTRGLSEPLLVVDVGDLQWKYLAYTSGQVAMKDLSEPLSSSQVVRINHISDQKFVAMLLKRPVMRLLSIPLQVLSDSPGAPSVLYLEHQLEDDEIEQALDSINMFLQPLGVVLEKLLVEEQLLRSAFQWESTFANIPAPIAVIEGNYNLTRGNVNFLTTDGDKCYEIFAGRKKPCVGCPVFQVISSGEAQASRIHRDGKLYEVHSYPISLASSVRVSHVVNYYIDITQERDLYGKVIQSEKISAVGLLAGNIAHELNNPLTGLRSLARVLMSSLKAEDQIAMDLAEVEKAAQRCELIIKNLLEFASPSEQRLTSFSLDDLIEKTVPMLKTAFRQHRTHFILNASEARVRVEPHLMQQVIFNIVNNACQAMPDASGDLTVKSQTDETTVKLTISDTGTGIPKDTVETIFEPFFTTKSEGKGTGLGLSMARSVVESFGGSIRVSDTSESGTTFEILLPRERT